MPRPYLGVEITHPSANLVGADPRTMSFHRADDATGERGLGGGGGVVSVLLFGAKLVLVGCYFCGRRCGATIKITAEQPRKD